MEDITIAAKSISACLWRRTDLYGNLRAAAAAAGANPMSWADTIVDCLKQNDVWLISYVPDAISWNVLSKLEKDPAFKVVPATREEEAVGIASGAYAAGRRSAVFMQSSGFGNTINGLAQFPVPYRVSLPLFIGMRGGLGEFNAIQVPAARAIPSILDTLHIQHYAPQREDEVARVVNGALELCYASREPVGILLYSMLTGAKRATS
jgi:sulfopyruvate decarboxylase alpha subunit